VTEKKYRLKQTYEAFRWDGSPAQIEERTWGEEAIRNGHIRFDGLGSPDAVLLMGSKCGNYVYTVNSGDWIIYGGEGDLSSCKPYFFHAIYEVVDIPEPAVKQELKIVQLIHVPPVNLGYTGYLLGLGSDGAVYCKNGDTKWHVHFHNRFADEKRTRSNHATLDVPT